jgi:hypothetical protein
MSTINEKREHVKIIYEPLKEVVIKEYTYFESIEDLIYIFAQLRASGAPAVLNWANGLAFVYAALPPDSDQLIDEFLKGRIYWATVSFAKMPQYKQVVETKEKIQVPVINASSNAILSQVTEWLKQQK